jgi:hypothetical protein
VAPVKYRLDGEQIIFGLGLQLKPQLPCHPEVSFEVDWIDWEHRMGWSVLAQGIAHECEDPNISSAGLWSPGGSQVLMCIALATVLGRRLLPAELIWPAEGDGYLSPRPIAWLGGRPWVHLRRTGGCHHLCSSTSVG